MIKVPRPDHQSDPLYQETQRFNQRWLQFLIVVMGGFTWYSTASIFLENSIQDIPIVELLITLVTWVIIGIGFPLLFLFYIKLVTEVYEDGVYVRFFPIHLRYRYIPYTAIKSCESVTYKPLAHYGGWGIRISQHGKAYNVSGNRGIQFEFQNGKRLLIGSQSSDEFWQSVQLGIKIRDKQKH
jgi:hypothetical protein